MFEQSFVSTAKTNKIWSVILSFGGADDGGDPG